ncbi:unnamed protein product, partial [Lymnaea stagnalis]
KSEAKSITPNKPEVSKTLLDFGGDVTGSVSNTEKISSSQFFGIKKRLTFSKALPEDLMCMERETHRKNFKSGSAFLNNHDTQPASVSSDPTKTSDVNSAGSLLEISSASSDDFCIVDNESVVVTITSEDKKNGKRKKDGVSSTQTKTANQKDDVNSTQTKTANQKDDVNSTQTKTANQKDDVNSTQTNTANQKDDVNSPQSKTINKKLRTGSSLTEKQQSIHQPKTLTVKNQQSTHQPEASIVRHQQSTHQPEASNVKHQQSPRKPAHKKHQKQRNVNKRNRKNTAAQPDCLNTGDESQRPNPVPTREDSQSDEVRNITVNVTAQRQQNE